MAKHTATNTKFEIDGKPVARATRADRRRMLAEVRRTARYGKSGFVDRAQPTPFVPKQRTDLDGMPHPLPFTPDELHARAVARRDQNYGLLKAVKFAGISNHELVRLMDTRAPHANRSTPERNHKNTQPAKGRARDAYRKGVENNARGLHADGSEAFPLRYMNRGERWRALDAMEAAAVPMAA